jgi:TrmH family RNA methyltransferase
MDLSLQKIPVSEKGFYVVAESLEKPGNLGTIMRTADATGVKGIILCDKKTDAHNPNVVRASVGTLFTVPVAEATCEECYEWLCKNTIKVVAATPDGKHCYTDVDYTGPVAIVLGTEQLGISSFWRDKVQEQVFLPMLGQADSLNVAMAATVMFYEVQRQRNWQ